MTRSSRLGAGADPSRAGNRVRCLFPVLSGAHMSCSPVTRCLIAALAGIVLLAACTSGERESAGAPRPVAGSESDARPRATTSVQPPTSPPPPTTTLRDQLSGCSPARPAPAPVPTTADPTGTGLQVLTRTYGGLERTYSLAVPEGYDGTTPTPLLLSFHGHGSNKEIHEGNTALARTAASRGYLAVTPDALGDSPAWNMFADPTGADDFGFVVELVDELASQLCVDPDRIYAAGHSNGSAFAAFAACRSPFPFAAVALVAATAPSGCSVKVAPSVLAIAGTADPQVPYQGGSVAGSATRIPAAREVVAAYAGQYGCRPESEVTEPMPGVEQLRYHDCIGGAEVILDTIEAGMHAWPGSPGARLTPGNSEPAIAFSADQAILDFFDRHRRTWEPG